MLTVLLFLSSAFAFDVQTSKLAALQFNLRNYLEEHKNNLAQSMIDEKIGRVVKVNTRSSRSSVASSEEATPVVQMHGMGDWAQDPFGMVPLAEDISEYLGGAYVLNVQIGNSSIEDIMNSFFMNLDDQVDYFYNVVSTDPNLVNGFNAIGYSQGNLLIRGYIERYNNPPVFNFISMHGPLAGVAGFPGCPIDREFCLAFDELLGAMAYYPRVQEGLCQANYYRSPTHIEEYLANDLFLADVNNERDAKDSSYNANWVSMESVCLVQALGDTVVIPRESEWFGAYEDGAYETILSYEQTEWYINDYFGLQTLNNDKKLFFNTTDGNHLDFETDYLLDLVGIYFV